MSTKFSIVYADPPWKYSDRALAGKRGASCHYSTMAPCELEQLDVQSITDKNAALFLWATMPQLPVAIRIMEAWGFTYKTTAFVWVKTTKISGKPRWGMGHYSRSNAEVVLLGVKGRIKRISASVHSVVMAPGGAHSSKPAEVRDRIVELMGDLPRCELFAREKPEGWMVWGEEVESDFELGRKTE